MICNLDHGWKLKLADDARVKGEPACAADIDAYPQPWIDAAVPGDWPLDYVREGLLEDPYFGDGYLKLLAYETYHVFYSLKFMFPPDSGALADEYRILRFDGIDTVADVYLNGVKLGRAENMFIPHEFEARGLKQGENELFVHIYPVVLEARKYPISPECRALRYNYESLVVRKSASMFGWDICPRIVSSGIWRPVALISAGPERLENVYLRMDAFDDYGNARCTLVYDADIGREPVGPFSVRVEGACGDSTFSVTQRLWFTHGRTEFVIHDPRLWQPRGYGNPDMYDIKAILLKNGQTVDEMRWRQGFRTVRLERDEVMPETGNAKFCFLINGKCVYIKGTNWVPADAFHSRDAERIPKILDMLWDVGCNAVRVWGGGVYENDSFYDWCDSHGIIVWQDFMMACGIYPQTPGMKERLGEEATAVVRRLRRHACVCLWAGDNECDDAWIAHARTDPAKNVLTREVLPDVLRAECPDIPYLPSSPYVSPASYAAGKYKDLPERHLWGPRDYFKGPFYHDHRAAFASEIGYHGCPSPGSVRRFVPEDSLWPEKDRPMWLYHAASPETDADAPYNYRIALMSRQLRYLFSREPRSLDEYARLSQISQAEAKKYFVESFRCRKGVRTGLIWWNLIDCWPQFSDAVVDYYFTRKLAYFFIRRSQQPLCLMMDDYTGAQVLYAVWDGPGTVKLEYRVWDVTSGRDAMCGSAEVGPDNAESLCGIPDDGQQRFLGIEWKTVTGATGRNHYLQGKPPFEADWYLACLRKIGFDEFEGF